jgi:hypothetical protein
LYRSIATGDKGLFVPTFSHSSCSSHELEALQQRLAVAPSSRSLRAAWLDFASLVHARSSRRSLGNF